LFSFSLYQDVSKCIENESSWCSYVQQSPTIVKLYQHFPGCIQPRYLLCYYVVGIREIQYPCYLIYCFLMRFALCDLYLRLFGVIIFIQLCLSCQIENHTQVNYVVDIIYLQGISLFLFSVQYLRKAVLNTW